MTIKKIVDETGFNFHLRRSQAVALKGKSVSVVVPTLRGRNTTLFSAISSLGIVHYKIFAGSCTAKKVSSFLRKLDEKTIEEYNITDGVVYKKMHVPIPLILPDLWRYIYKVV